MAGFVGGGMCHWCMRQKGRAKSSLPLTSTVASLTSSQRWECQLHERKETVREREHDFFFLEPSFIDRKTSFLESASQCEGASFVITLRGRLTQLFPTLLQHCLAELEIMAPPALPLPNSFFISGNKTFLCYNAQQCCYNILQGARAPWSPKPTEAV
jgi:hypothetical protein